MASWDAGTAYTTGQPLRSGTPFSSQEMVYSGAIGNFAGGGGLSARPAYASRIASTPTDSGSRRPQPRSSLSEALAESPGKRGPNFSIEQGENTKAVNAKLMDIIQTASADSPYKVEVISGYRKGDRRQHGKSHALDVSLIDPNTGKAVPNYQDAAGFPIYEEFAKRARAVQMQKYPELGDNFRWGGYFSGPSGKYGAMDLMHFDVNSGMGMAGGSWDSGLTPQQKQLLAATANGQTYANLWGRAPIPKETAMAYADQPSAGRPFDAVMGGGGSRNLVGGDVPNPPANPRRGMAPEPAQSAMQAYTVQPGDTLWNIAEQTLGSGERWQELAQVNGITDPRSLQPGQTLRIVEGQARPGESMTRPEDYISGQATQRTPEGMSAGNYQSRADQIPNPQIAPPRQAPGIPNPPMRPTQTGQLMSDAEFRQTVDGINALKSGRPQPVQIGGNPPLPGLMPQEERQRIIQEIEALRQKVDAANEPSAAPRFPASSIYDGRDVSTANSPLADLNTQSFDPEIERAMVDRMRQLDAQGVPYDEATQIAINEARTAQMGQPVFVSQGGVRIFAER